MTYLQFYNQWHPFACFNTQQVKSFESDFNRDNYLQWQRNGYIVSLRQGWYAFSDYRKQPDYARYFAGKIYAPSYISLHAALAFYGIIPETVVEITCVSTMKTARFENDFGIYSYQHIRPSLFWGYESLVLQDGKRYMIATPEKALLDLLYLYPQYQTEADMLDLRLDEDWLEEEFNKDRMTAYIERIASPSLTKRVKTLMKAYQIC